MGIVTSGIMAFFTRLVFAIHALIAIGLLIILTESYRFLYLGIPVLLLFFESIFTVIINSNREWKWFCPSIFLYLASVVPAIVFLEFYRRGELPDFMKSSKTPPSPASNSLANLNLTRELMKLNLQGLSSTISNQTQTIVNINLTEIPSELGIDVVGQALMLILILGRWLLPKGELTRDELSQLLLVYIGTSADIIEFFGSTRAPPISTDKNLVILVMGIWIWCLMQFTIVLTSTKPRKSKSSHHFSRKKPKTSCCSVEIWTILSNIMLQDGPFLVFRMILIFQYGFKDYTNYFFSCKNVLVIFFQFYRLVIVLSETKEKNRKIKERYKRQNEILPSISVVSRNDLDFCGHSKKYRKYYDDEILFYTDSSSSESEIDEIDDLPLKQMKKCKRKISQEKIRQKKSRQSKEDDERIERIKNKNSRKLDRQSSNLKKNKRRVKMKDENSDFMTSSLENIEESKSDFEDTDYEKRHKRKKHHSRY